jgi:alkyl hydroperoxide reductase subunit AhpC
MIATSRLSQEDRDDPEAWRHRARLTAQTTEGEVRFHEWIGDSWAVLFSHPRDFRPVCTTELGYMARIKPEFESRNVKIIGLSVDPLDDHEKWAKDIEETRGPRPTTR